ncbi:MAG: ASKHA domain-containing protein [Thermodesulfobacteriota bacterium]
MGKCVNHPQTETPYKCQKHGIYMCQDCLHCKDPNIYCKFRSSCPIWFIHQERQNEERRSRQEADTDRYQVHFAPDNVQIEVQAGSTLLQAAQEAGLKLNASCNGAGTCGKCKLLVNQGQIQSADTPLLTDSEKAKGYVLACQSTVHGDLEVMIPEETLERRMRCAGIGEQATAKLLGCVQEISPLREEFFLELSPPTTEDNVSDLDRLKRGLKKKNVDPERMNITLEVMRQLASALRQENWSVTASVIRKKCSYEVLHVHPGHEEHPRLGLAVDVGTTTVMVYLVDLQSAKVLAGAGGHNKQAACGDDIINRIVCAEKSGVQKLGKMVLSTINGLINEVLDSSGMERQDIGNVVVSGNTTMAHLLLQLEPRYLRRTPYIPTASDFPIFKAKEIGLKTDPAAPVFVLPGPASYVGGDIVSGILYSGLHKQEPITLFVDVGTNGEIVLGNQDWLLTAACSAGPAFEGGGIRWGMRAEEGAIEQVDIDPESKEPRISSIGQLPARGICGTGMIDTLSEMFLTKVIDQSGHLQVPEEHPRLTYQTGEKAYVLEWAQNTSMDEDIVFTESDIQNLLRSKGAVYAGFRTLLGYVGLSFADLDRVLIAGGFGEYLDVDKAVNIGLLPDLDRDKFQYLGNTSLAGAYMCLLNQEARTEAEQICNNMTYLDFSDNNAFMDEFTSALFLPHTELQDFPSLQEKLKAYAAN